MALKSSPCICTASASAAFVRRIANIDLVAGTRHRSYTRSLLAAGRVFSTFRPLESRETSHHEITNTTAYVTADFTDSTPFDQTRRKGRLHPSKPGRSPSQSSTMNNLNTRRWAVGDLKKKHTASTRELTPPMMTYKIGRIGLDSGSSNLAGTMQQDKKGAAFLELNAETIKTLAAKSLEDNECSKGNAAEPKWEARPNRARAVMKGFRMHYSSTPVAPPTNARNVKNRDSISSESQLPDLVTADHRNHPVIERQPWHVQKAALKEKFKEGWSPRKKLSPDALAGIRAIHAQFPEQYTTSVLAKKFEVSPEAIRRILKSSWTPKEVEVLDRQRRWFLRGQKVWSRYAELGLKPPARWRKLGIRKKGNLAAGRRERKSVDPNITMRSADHAARESNENLSTTPASMAERIL